MFVTLELARLRAQERLSKLPVEQVNTIYQEIARCFALWKSKHGQAPCRGGGLIMPREPEPERFDEAKAWECAGESVRNRIDLAFKIRAEWFPPFVKLQDKIGFDRILAALIMLPQNPIYAESVWRAMDFLHDWDKAEQNARLAEGRRKAGVERQKKAEPEREKLNKSVKDIFNDPHKLWWSDKKIANSLESRFSYTRSTLEKYVAEEAAKHRRARKVAADENNSPELRGRMYAELAQYVAPKRKAIEHSADFGGGTFADLLMSLGSCSDGAKAESLNSTDEEQK